MGWSRRQYMSTLLLSCACVWSHISLYVGGHGRMVEPPSRASMWRYGYDTEPDFHDNQAWCGGHTTQWKLNSGKCGVCGDRWDAPAPRDHELGGRYGRGIIVRRYRPGDVITVIVELTAAHAGYFELRVCPVEYVTDGNRTRSDPSMDCLDGQVLQLAGAGGSTRYVLGRRTDRMHSIDVQLPGTLHCQHCLLQWKYNTGNSWGRAENGTMCLGCGAQEQFYACADIAVDNRTTSTRRLSTSMSTTTTSLAVRQRPVRTTAVPLAATQRPIDGKSAGVETSTTPWQITSSNRHRAPATQPAAGERVLELGGQRYSISSTWLPRNMTELDLVRVWESKGRQRGSVYVLPQWYLIADESSRQVHVMSPDNYRRLAVTAARRLVDSLVRSSITHSVTDRQTSTPLASLSQLIH